MLHALGHGGGIHGSAWRWQPKLRDGAGGWHPPAEVARPGMGRSILPFGSMIGGQPEPTLPGSCFGEDWFPGGELGSQYLRE